ncbi:MAG TPA: sugar phosphate isomerase/epimerase [Opitutaceae bacterium]|nr:sugar phosphate isomerase/epimerase [Opitutaceae bacterium]
MNVSSLSRRELLKSVAAGLAAAPLLNVSTLLGADTSSSTAPSPASATSLAAHDTPLTRSPLKLGIASISLKNLSLDAVIATLHRLGLEYVSLYRTHAPWGGDVDACRVAGEKLRAARIHLMATGVVNLPNDEAVVRKAFETAKAAQLPVMTCRPNRDAFPLIERFVKEYNIRLAIHNHGPEDKLYPTPKEAWDAAEKYDERIGLCIDVGHTSRTAMDPVEAIEKYTSRLYDLHIKDTVAPIGAEDIPVELGRGRMKVAAILQALIKVKYAGQVGVEYEVEGPGKEDPVPGVAESIGFLRGVLSTLKSA